MNEPLRQAYDEQGRPIAGKGYTKPESFSGLLHGAAHVWIWRRSENVIEVLLQKRATTKSSWPGCLDISAAGHIDLGEDPLEAAAREVREEIGLALATKDLTSIGVHRAYLLTDSGLIENEYQFLYLYELKSDIEFILQAEEVGALEWKSLEDFKQAVTRDEYVPHGLLYYQTVIENIQKVTQKS